MQLLDYKQHSFALLKLGLPIVVGQLGIIVLSLADTLMVGRYGTDELAAAGFVNNMFNLVIMFATGFSYGLTPIVGRLFGRNDSLSIGGRLKNGLFANLLMAILLTLGMVVLYLNLHRVGQPEELLPLMRPYYLTLLISIVFVMLFNAFKQFADGI
ncbi:MAG: MATE family efflux transporter, partial [Bacteroidaceae bacterium]|nr:MATE family efflux transporter [Bacteroidaceae bacterium]